MQSDRPTDPFAPLVEGVQQWIAEWLETQGLEFDGEVRGTLRPKGEEKGVDIGFDIGKGLRGTWPNR